MAPETLDVFIYSRHPAALGGEREPGFMPLNASTRRRGDRYSLCGSCVAAASSGFAFRSVRSLSKASRSHTRLSSFYANRNLTF